VLHEIQFVGETQIPKHHIQYRMKETAGGNASVAENMKKKII